ncbi:hypothetical protein NECAME_00856 [Necator americanus]|uniref:Uncharacterized protein n=1 Tax=Necator americanus TaxID=51031 RepID=W2SR41_NECAM|nr:hypothetical protein NECAME_00856 [Necator americanus]ETN71167.1 hypothetical protein NECAME_00856 [Necator americanus]
MRNPSSIGMRPSEDILNEFYGLVELEADKRFKAISRLFSKVKSEPSVQEYCIERLVTGLSSTRGAARFGYSTALVLFLSEYYEHWPIEKLFALADKKLDLQDKVSGNANAIAHHLLACAIFQSGVYAECDSILLEHEFGIYRLHPNLGMTVVQLVAEIALGMERKKDGSCKFSDDDLTFLLLTVKKCDNSCLDSFLKLLLASARASGQFSLVYKDVVEKWCTAGDESKVLERIFDTAKLTLSTGEGDHKESLNVSDPLCLLSFFAEKDNTNRSGQAKCSTTINTREGNDIHITEFCKFTEEYLSAVTGDSELLEVIETLDTSESFDSLSGSNLVDHLVGRLSRDGVAEWIKTADKRWSLRHVCAAFGHWSNESRVEVLKNLLKRPKSEEIQYTVGNCIDSLFKMKVRAGELVNVSLIEGADEVLKKVTESLFGKDVVKNAMKKMNGNPIYKSVLPVFWMCLKLWSKIAPTNHMSEGYQNNAEELHIIVKEGEEGLKVLLDQLLALLSQPLKYHRTVVYYVYVNLLSHIKEEHVAHIIETLTMDDDELVEDEDSDEKASSEEGEGMNDDEEEEENESELESSDEEEIDPETVSRLEGALGKAAVKRKADALDEEETDASEVGDEEMFAMDDRLAAAFKAMTPKKENKMTAHMASAFRLKLADLLLFTLSSQNTPSLVKVHMMVPLLKLAKLQLKQDAEGHSSRKTIGLLNIIARLKKIHTADEEVVTLLDQLIQEDTILDAFVGLFERFMTQEDGLIGCELAIAAVIKHPEVFVPRSKMFLKAGFNADYRIFRKASTEALLCLAGMMTKNVQNKVSAEKSTVKGVAKSCSEYLSASVAEPESIKPRFFASVLKLLWSTVSGINEELKGTLQKHLALEVLNEDESRWSTICKKVNAACQQICGKSAARVLSSVQSALEQT